MRALSTTKCVPAIAPLAGPSGIFAASRFSVQTAGIKDRSFAAPGCSGAVFPDATVTALAKGTREEAGASGPCGAEPGLVAESPTVVFGGGKRKALARLAAAAEPRTRAPRRPQ